MTSLQGWVTQRAVGDADNVPVPCVEDVAVLLREINNISRGVGVCDDVAILILGLTTGGVDTCRSHGGR